jgi:hypothetical protein
MLIECPVIASRSLAAVNGLRIVVISSASSQPDHCGEAEEDE